jgi:AraC-like DNA-binding protein
MSEGCTINEVAEYAGFTPRSLQRYLAKDGLTLALLKEERISMAIELLASPRYSVTEIALELGYKEAASFTRAFQRWNGVPPSQYRHQLLAATAPAGLDLTGPPRRTPAHH